MDARLRERSVAWRQRRRLVIATLVLLGSPAACRKEAPPPPREPPLDVGQVIDRLAGLQFDDAFFRDLETLKGAASKPGADAAAQDASVRFELVAVAAGLASGAEWLSKVTGGGPGDAGRVAAFLKGVAERAAARDEGLARDLRALAGAYDPSAVADLTGVLGRAEGDTPLAPAIRLVAIRRLLDALRTVAGAPDSERGPLLMQALPGWPNPPTSDPMQTAFPTALKHLSRWLALGEGGEKGLAPLVGKVRDEAAALLQAHAFPMPVVLDPDPRPSTPSVGLAGTYSPLVVATLKGDELRVGLRPVLGWKDGQVSDLATERVFPGVLAAASEALSRVTDALVETVGATLREVAEAATPIEARAYPQAGAARNADRKDRGRALLWAVEGAQVARRVETAITLAERAGFTEVRLLQPGSFFRVLPVFFRKVPDVPGVEAPKGARVLVALGPGAAEVYPPTGGPRCKVPGGAWPEGVRVLQQGRAITGLQVRWEEQAGFKGLLAAALGKWLGEPGSGCTLSPAVPVIVRSRDLPAAMLLDAAAEVLAASGPAFTGIADWFPGLACGDGNPCPAAVPILFALDRVPKPAKAEAAVEVSRPAGFCDKKDVARVMNGRAGAVRACYEMHLQRNPDLAGRLEVRFTIEEDGTISGLAVTVNDLSQEVAACVLRQISNLKFAKPAGGVCVIRWPYRFKPGG